MKLTAKDRRDHAMYRDSQFETLWGYASWRNGYARGFRRLCPGWESGRRLYIRFGPDERRILLADPDADWQARVKQGKLIGQRGC